MEVTIEKIDIKKDKRGSVFEPLTREEISEQRNVHLVLTEPGYVRGNHFHQKGKEILVVRGPALIKIRPRKGSEEIEIHEGEVIKLTVPPGVSHAVKNTGEETNFLIAFNTVVHDPENPDVVEDILIQAII